MGEKTIGGEIVSRRRVFEIGALAWAGVGVGVAFMTIGLANSDARLIVAAAAILGPLAAVGSARLLAHGLDRIAGAFLLVSVLTPTYFAWVLNVPALAVGLGLLVIPRSIVSQHHR